MSQKPSQHPLDALWQAQALLWVVLTGECIAAVLALAQDGDGNRWIHFGLASFFIQWIVLLTLGVLYITQRLIVMLRPLHAAWLALGVLLVNTWIVGGMARFLLGPSWPATPDGWPGVWLRVTGIVIAVGFLGLAAFRNHWHARQFIIRAKEAELEALQARVRPHFLFNTLNSGIALVRQHPEQAEELLLGLSDLFRAALARPHDVALGEELALVRRYLEIEAVRFGPRLRVAWQLPEPLPEMEVPALSVQALVENAVRHGIERLPDGGEVGIEVARHADAVVIAVRNPVPAGAEGGGEGHSIGLQATRARLQASTGGRGSLASGREGDAFVARIRLPVV